MISAEERMLKFFASSPQNLRQIPTLNITHSAFTQNYAFWTEPYPADVITESGQAITMYPVNMKIGIANNNSENMNQDFKISLDLTDAQDVLRSALNLIPKYNREQIKVDLREYLSDSLTAPVTSYRLGAQSIAYNQGVGTIACGTPRFNSASTGTTYTPYEIDLLKGFS